MVKRILFQTLSLKYYLRLLHVSFHFLYKIKALKNNHIYKYHYFDASVIRKGDHILDIGANLGYYTKLFAKWVGKNGVVYAVEPVPVFAETIRWGLRNYNNVVLYNFALGNEEREITLSTPGKFGYLKTGLAHISQGDEQNEPAEFTFNATMKRPSDLFGNIQKLDFIKCDIEGYETVVIPAMEMLISKFKPVIQIETWGEQKPVVEDYLKKMGYEEYNLENNRLVPINESNWQAGDLFFIHKDNCGVLDRLRQRHLA